MYKLIKIENYWVVVDINKQPVNGLYYDNFVKKIKNTNGSEYGKAKDITWQILFSQNPEHNLPTITFSNEVAKELSIVDVEKLAEKQFPKNEKTSWGKGYSYDNEKRREGFVKGYNQCLTNNADKKFTEEDLKNIMYWVANMTSGLRDSGRSLSDIDKQLNIKIQSLTKQEYSCVIETEEVEDYIGSCGHTAYPTYSKQPKITNNSVKILKIWK